MAVGTRRRMSRTLATLHGRLVCARRVRASAGWRRSEGRCPAGRGGGVGGMKILMYTKDSRLGGPSWTGGGRGRAHRGRPQPAHLTAPVTTALPEAAPPHRTPSTADRSGGTAAGYVAVPAVGRRARAACQYVTAATLTDWRGGRPAARAGPCVGSWKARRVGSAAARHARASATCRAPSGVKGVANRGGRCATRR